MTEYGLGRLFAPDDRDRKFLMRSVIPSPAGRPPYRYYRTGPVLHQGNTPSCVGHAWAAFLMAAPVMSKNIDPFDIYRGAQNNDEWEGNDYEGSSVRGGAKYLQSQGRLSRYVWAWDVDTIAAFILSGQGGVVMGTPWTYDMFEPDSKGFIHPTGPIAGGHAWFISGCNWTRGIFRKQGSWGPRWAQDGRAWITAEDLETLLRWDSEACAALEVKL